MPTENKIDCPALHKRFGGYPYGDRVPRTVRMLVTVTSDRILDVEPAGTPEAKEGHTYAAWTNSHGAVTAVMGDGKRLGLRPAEFEVDSWHHLAAEPAPQPQAEPIAWMVGTAFWWTKEKAERDAAATGLPIVGLGPMTCSTEVEQLREVIKHSDAQLMRQSMRISNQRAQQAEAQALLREADEFMYIMTAHDGHAKLAHRYGKDWWDAIDKLRGKVCTALSASAEPSAPGKQGSSIRAVRAPEIQDLLDRAATAIGQYGDSLLGRGKREDSIDLLDLEREVRDLEQEFKGAFGQPCTQENICTSKL